MPRGDRCRELDTHDTTPSFPFIQLFEKDSTGKKVKEG